MKNIMLNIRSLNLNHSLIMKLSSKDIFALCKEFWSVGPRKIAGTLQHCLKKQNGGGLGYQTTKEKSAKCDKNAGFEVKLMSKL